jgi:hypothetical protein
MEGIAEGGEGRPRSGDVSQPVDFIKMVGLADGFEPVRGFNFRFAPYLETVFGGCHLGQAHLVFFDGTLLRSELN